MSNLLRTIHEILIGSRVFFSPTPSRIVGRSSLSFFIHCTDRSFIEFLPSYNVDEVVPCL